MKKSYIRERTAGFFILLFILSGCGQADPQRADYIGVLNEWASLLQLANKGMTSEHIKTSSGGIVQFSLPYKVSSVKEHEHQWLAVKKAFRHIASETPPSHWSDDAAVCETFVGIVTHDVPIKSLGNGGIEAIWQILRNKEPIQLEADTIRTLKKHLYLGWNSKEADDVWLRSHFRNALISLLVGDGKLDEARSWLNRLREVGLTEQEHDELSKVIQLAGSEHQ